MLRTINKVKELPTNGHYSLATTDGNYVYLSGQFSVDPETGNKLFGTIDQELKQILNNIDLILHEAGSRRENIMKSTINSLDNWSEADRVYSEFFGSSRHSRTIVAIPELHYGFKVEMDVVACCDNRGE